MINLVIQVNQLDKVITTYLSTFSLCLITQESNHSPSTHSLTLTVLRHEHGLAVIYFDDSLNLTDGERDTERKKVIEIN